MEPTITLTAAQTAEVFRIWNERAEAEKWDAPKDPVEQAKVFWEIAAEVLAQG